MRRAALARATCALAGMSWVLGGCAPMTPMATATSKSCSEPGTCNVIVKVVNCNVTMDPDDLHVYYGPQQIMWKIDDASPNAKFTQDGIAFKSPTNEFTHLQVTGSGRMAILIDANGRVGRYDYKVTLTDGGRTCTLDPGIINHG
jgi:hypothetical protein